MLKIEYHKRFKKDYKRCLKRGYKIDKLHEVIELLANGKRLPEKYHEHYLVGDYNGFRECHIQPDWLLIYRIDDEMLELFLLSTGSHADLFE